MIYLCNKDNGEVIYTIKDKETPIPNVGDILEIASKSCVKSYVVKSRSMYFLKEKFVTSIDMRNITIFVELVKEINFE